MALIKCHECGGAVSDHARACPKCGAPVLARIRRRRKAYLIELAVSVVFAAIMIFFVMRLVNRLKGQALPPATTQNAK